MTDTPTLPQDSPEKPKGGTPVNRQAAYSKAASYFNEAMDVIVELMRNAKQESVRSSCANTIVAKVLPDLKATELTGEGGHAIRIVVEDYGTSHPTPTQTTGESPSK